MLLCLSDWSEREEEISRLWRELGVSSWSEIEESDVDLPAVKRLLELHADPPQHLLLQLVDFDYSNSGRSVYAANDRGVRTWIKCGDYDRVSRLGRREPAAVLNIADLIARNDAEDLRRLPIIVLRNERSGRIVQFQFRIT